MSNSIYDLTDIFTKDRVLASLKHAQDTDALLRLDIHTNKATKNTGEDVELLWEVTEGDYLADKSNTLGYGVDYITAIFECDYTESEIKTPSYQAALISLDSIKVETDAQSIEGDLYLPKSLDLSIDDFRQVLGRLEAKQNAEGWLQPPLGFKPVIR